MVSYRVSLPWVVHGEEVAVEAVRAQTLVEVALVDGRFDLFYAEDYLLVFDLGVAFFLFHDLIFLLPWLVAFVDGVDLLEVVGNEPLHLILLHHRTCIFC